MCEMVNSLTAALLRHAPDPPSCCRLMERNGTGRSVLFNNISLSVHDPFPIRVYFLSVLIHFRVTQSILARGSLTYAVAPVPFDSLVVLLYRSWLQYWIALNFSITNGQA